METQITVIRTSMRGAHLITDGTRVCWIQGRCLRSDMSLTRMGLECLEAATMSYEDYLKEAKQREEQREAEKQAKEVEREHQREKVQVMVKADALQGETDKALKIWAGNYTRMYGKVVKSYEYFPKSQVRVAERLSENIVILEMPIWFYNNNQHTLSRIILED